jgi:N-acetylglutamate synthase-like GNAT family acetyltransferase
MTTIVRRARPSDVGQIAELIAEYAREGTMLAKSPEAIELALDDFVVAVDRHQRVMACGALKEYSPSLAEVASLAVSRTAHGKGLGRRIVAAVENLARQRGIAELFALTLTPAFFEAVGYSVTERSRYPEKMRRDCVGCARRFACGEICVWRPLEAVPMPLVAAA